MENDSPGSVGTVFPVRRCAMRPLVAPGILLAFLLAAGGGRADPEDLLPFPETPILSLSLRSRALLPVQPVAGEEPFLVFLADDPGGETGFWRTDGTKEGTFPLARPWPDGQFPLGDPVAFDGAVWVLASTLGGEMGLYRSDGSAAGTGLAVSTGVTEAGSNHGLIPCGGRLFFAGIPAGATDPALIASDGTPSGTGVVRADGRPRVQWGYGRAERDASGALLYFLGTTPEEGSELWRSDGTEAGTLLVKDIRPGPSDSLHADFWKTETVGGLFYFPADDGVTGLELWRTDGTVDGTSLVTDLAPGSAGSDPICMGAVGGLLVFGARGGGRDRDIWATDGTEEGTVLLHDFPEPPEFTPSGAVGLGKLGGLPYFVSLDAPSGPGLWRTDGTPAGTVLVKGLDPCVQGAGEFHALPGTGVSAFDIYDGELVGGYCTDGTAGGTVPCGVGSVQRVWKGGVLASSGYGIGGYGPLLRASYGYAGFSESDADDDGDGFSTELEDATGSAWWDPASTPLGPPPVPATQPLSAKRAALRVSARIADTDSLRIEGTLPVAAGFEPEGRTVTVDAGGLIRTFTLDARGRARGPGKEEFRLALRRRKGVVREDPETSFQLRLTEGRFMGPLADEGLFPYAGGGERTLPVTVLWEGRAYRSSLSLTWSVDRRFRGRARWRR